MKIESKSKEELIEYITELTAKLEDTETKLAKSNALVDYYVAQFKLYQKQQFGSKSEKIDSGQLNLFNEAERESNLKIEEPELVEASKATVKKPRKPKRSRDVIYKDLPVERHEHHLENDICPQCQSTLHVIRKEIKRQLKVIPAQVVVVEDAYDVCGCRNCELTGIHTPIITAPTPKRIIPGSIASSSMIAYVMEQKYVNSMPLYRQEQQFKRLGVELSRQNLANWMVKGSEWLEILYDRMHDKLIEKDIVLADETSLQVLKEPGKAASTKSYMWLYRTGRTDDHSIVLYEYQPSRQGKHAKNFLNGFSGYLQVDGYAGYEIIPKVTLSGCWAHARRKFYEAILSQPKKSKDDKSLTYAEQGFVFCTRLYEVEQKIKESTSEERHKIRLEKSRPILDGFFVWLNETSLKVLPKSKIGQAISYTINQWSKLKTYLLDGLLEIDNNRAERSIKPFVIGRKNFMFSNTPKGAKASAVIYSMVETAKENGLKPLEYLTYLLEQLPNIDIKNQDQLDALLPWSVNLPESCKLK